jgi:hypothetical protein
MNRMNNSEVEYWMRVLAPIEQMRAVAGAITPTQIPSIQWRNNFMGEFPLSMLRIVPECVPNEQGKPDTPMSSKPSGLAVVPSGILFILFILSEKLGQSACALACHPVSTPDNPKLHA